MVKNTFGHIFRITTFGESHGPALGVVVDGCPAGVTFDEELLSRHLRRRRPGAFGTKNDGVISQRKEEDLPEVLSGVYHGKTLGTPLTLIVRNCDVRSQDYADIEKSPRPGHADDVWKMKFGHSDPRGGGRSSGRETVARVMAGAVAEMYLRQVLPEFKIVAYSSQIGPFVTKTDFSGTREEVDGFRARYPCAERESAVEKLLLEAKEKGLSYGGKVKLQLEGVPAGLGQPVFHKLKCDLAAAFFSIGAVSAVELGVGTDVASAEGSEFHSARSEAYGGIRGGISTGEKIDFTISFKPTSSVLDVAKKGRHDPCIVPRAIPVIEAMSLLVVADHCLWAKLDRI